jgi:hypothetical protein
MKAALGLAETLKWWSACLANSKVLSSNPSTTKEKKTQEKAPLERKTLLSYRKRKRLLTLLGLEHKVSPVQSLVKRNRKIPEVWVLLVAMV